MPHPNVRPLRKTAIATAIALAYLGAYSGLSACGEFRPKPSGVLRYSDSGVAIFDLMVWYHKWTRRESWKSIDGSTAIDANALGIIFLPLINLDRQYIHPTFAVRSQTGAWEREGEKN